MNVTELESASKALSAWCESQGLTPGEAVAVMAHLIGVMAAHKAADVLDLVKSCETAFNLTIATANCEFLAKG